MGIRSPDVARKADRTTYDVRGTDTEPSCPRLYMTCKFRRFGCVQHVFNLSARWHRRSDVYGSKVGS